MSKIHSVKISITFKVYAIVLLSVFFCAVVIGISNYYTNKNLLGQNIGEGLKKIAQTAVLGIDADELGAITSSEDYSYTDISDYLRKVKVENDIDAPIYILERKSPSKASMVLTTEPSFLLGAEYRLNPTMKRVFDTGKSCFSPIYTDKSGTWISAYAPLKNNEGRMIGALELNQEVGYYIRLLHLHLFRIILLCLIGCVFGILLSIPFLRPILSSIKALSAATREMEKRNYDHEIKLKSHDEIGDLAAALENMRVSIKDYIKQLKEAQSEIVRSEKLATIGKLTAGVSHELRNPLSMIKTSIYFLKTKLSPSLKDIKIKKHLNTIEAEVNNADRIIRDILTFGRIKKPHLAKTDINAALKASLLKVPIPADIKVVEKLDDKLPEALADKEQLAQVFFNIILNGFQAMPEGGTLTVNTSFKNDYVEARIADTGVGVPEDNLSKIFDPLFSTKPKGTGLGLSICQSIIEGHGGIIEVESLTGKTNFIIKLPVSAEK